MNTKLGTFKWFQAETDVKLRYFQSETKEHVKGTIIVLFGRASFIEKCEAIIQFWILKNYQVFALDWRGHGASIQPSLEGKRIHIDDYSSYVTDLEKWIDSEVIPQAKKPIALYAVSMGALIAGLFLKQDVQKRIDKCFMIAPMFGLLTRSYPLWIVKVIVKAVCSVGLGKVAVPGFKYEPSTINTDLNSIPYGLTFSWLDASFRALRYFSEDRELHRIQTSIFIAMAENDTTIDNAMVIQICDQIPNCTFKIYKGADHGIHADTSVRSLLFQDCWDFLQN